MKRYLGAALLIASAACAKKATAPSIQTAAVTRRDIIIEAQGNGVIEPIVVVDVKSKAGGVVTQMQVETGTHVNTGDLIVQIDTRDVQNKYDQAKASLEAMNAKLAVSEQNKKRQEDLFKARVITAQEYEQTAVDFTNAQSSVVTAKANLDIAKQALEDATVKAPSIGTIITKNVAVGTVIAGANGSVSGGTTIVQMADLTTVRIRALFNETDIGNVHPGEQANVTVDAYPDRRFTGVVAKIEPSAVVQQNVTMFPVLVNLENAEGLLKPGMNGEVSVLIDERDGVLAIPNDAIKNAREAVATGAMLGMASDSIQAELRAQGFNSGGGGGRRGGNGGGGGGGRRGGAAGAGGAGNGTAGGEVALMDSGAAAPAQGGGQAGQGGGGGFGAQVSDDDCKKVDAVLKAHPKEKKQLDDLRAKMTALRPANFNGGGGGGGANGGANRNRGGDSTQAGGNGGQRRRGGTGGDSTQRRAGGDSTRRGGNGGGGGRGGSPEMQAITQQMQAIYTTLSLDPRTAGSCMRRAMGGGQANAGGAGGAGGRQRGQGGAGALTPSGEMGGRPARARSGLVFTSDSSKTVFHPRIVQLGQGNLDYTEVLTGLKEGERVVMLGALALQAQRQANLDRSRANASPLGGQQGPGGGPGGGGPPRGGGGGGRGG